MKQYRVIARNSKDGWDKTQCLQEKRWYGWATIDQEKVPRHAVVSQGCFGDTGGWVSKFTKYGSFGRDGVFTFHH